MRKYLGRAVNVFKEFGVDSSNTAPQELISLLEDVKHLDEAKVLAIADVIQHMSAFNALVRDNVEGISVGDRYMSITQMFDSVREDSKRLINQLGRWENQRNRKSVQLVDENATRNTQRSVREDRRNLQ